jgi:hypothetical protein
MRGYFNGVAAAMPFTAIMGAAQYQLKVKLVNTINQFKIEMLKFLKVKQHK